MTKRNRERQCGQRSDFAGARPPGGAGPLPVATGVVIGTILLVGALPHLGAETGSGEAVPARAADVARLYDKHCRSCHGVDGRGQDLREGLPTMPDFTSAAWHKARTDADLSRAVTEGSDPLMPAFREKLTKDQIEALTAHLRSFANATAVRKPMMMARRAAARPSPEQLFKDNACEKCHDKDGRGTTGRKIMPEIPDFTDAKWQKERGDDDLNKSILEGKGKFMVPQKDKLNKDEVKQLVDYIRSLKGKPAKDDPKDPPKADVAPASIPPKQAGPSPEEATLRVGAATYRDKCGNCHGADGKGNELRSVMPAIPDFTSRPWHQSRSDAQLSVSILDGKGTQMPSFRDKVKAEHVKGLLSYVRAFGPGKQNTAQAAEDFDQKINRLFEEFEELKKQRDELTKKSKQP